MMIDGRKSEADEKAKEVPMWKYFCIAIVIGIGLVVGGFLGLGILMGFGKHLQDSKRASTQGSTQSTNQESQSNIPTQWKLYRRFDGSGNLNTEPFEIKSKIWRLNYSLNFLSEPKGNASDSMVINVRPVGGKFNVGNFDCKQKAGSTYVYESGMLYLDITTYSNVRSWHIEIETPV